MRLGASGSWVSETGACSLEDYCSKDHDIVLGEKSNFEKNECVLPEAHGIASLA